MLKLFFIFLRIFRVRIPLPVHFKVSDNTFALQSGQLKPSFYVYCTNEDILQIWFTMKLFASIICSLSLIVVLSSCHKEGCTDPYSLNYDADATEDNFTCSYSGNMVFWTTVAARDSLITLGHTMLRFELDTNLVDSMATSSFSVSSGDCNSAGTKTIARTMVGNDVRTYKYRVKGNGFVTLYEGFVTVEADDCTSIKFQ